MSTVTSNGLWQDQQDGFTLSDYDYSMDMAAAQFDHSGRNADASYGLEVDTGQADADFFFTGSWDTYTRDQALQVAYQDYEFAKLDSTALYTHDHIEAKDARSESKNAAVRSYLVDSHEAQRQETASVADASIPFETQVAQVQNDYASGLQQRWGIWAGDVALADYHQSVNVADLDVDLSNDKQPWENIRTIADSDAVYAMGESVAGARETLVASWATALETPWAELQEEDKGTVAKSKTLQDTIAVQDELLNNRIDQAYWDYEHTKADLQRDLAKSVITQTQHDTQLATAEATRKQAIATANVDRASNVAIA